MAFAGNDLANFIGVSVAGVHAFLGNELSATLPTPTWVLLVSGLVMSAAIFSSKKAKTVINTEINLASHGKNVKNHWKENLFIKKLSDTIIFIYGLILKLVPRKLLEKIRTRFERTKETNVSDSAFDLLRASVNLMIAAAVISYATSHKLPLSTTYVTFMVAMGTALADGAWKKDCAPCRIAGVLTVISGWFITALIAFVFAGIIVSILYFTKIYGLLLMLLIVLVVIYKLFKIHKKRELRHKPTLP